jgi:hypothetical protein
VDAVAAVAGGCIKASDDRDEQAMIREPKATAAKADAGSQKKLLV